MIRTLGVKYFGSDTWMLEIIRISISIIYFGSDTYFEVIVFR